MNAGDVARPSVSLLKDRAALHCTAQGCSAGSLSNGFIFWSDVWQHLLRFLSASHSSGSGHGGYR